MQNLIHKVGSNTNKFIDYDAKHRIISGKPVTKYLVENSWGKMSIGDENIIMTPDYVDEFLYIIAVNKNYLPKAVRDIVKQKPTRLEVWDPFGYLLF